MSLKPKKSYQALAEKIAGSLWMLETEGRRSEAAGEAPVSLRQRLAAGWRAFDRGGTNCRAILNMRPLAVWWRLPPA